MKDIPLTVLMAVGNDERYIEKAMASILRQSFGDFEFLIVDDASSDATMRIVAGFADARVRVLTNAEHLGLTRSLNAGLRQARGTYIARMDGDDLSCPTRLEKQIAFLRDNPGCGLVGVGYKTIDERGCPLDEGRAFASGIDLKRALDECNQFAHASVMFPLEAVAAVGGYREFFFYAQDYDLFLRIAEKYSIALIPEILFARRLRLDSVSIRYKVLQDRFAAAARESARRRRAGLPDPAAAAVGGAAADDAAKASGLLPSKREKRAFAAEGFFAGALYFKNHRNGYAHRTVYVARLLARSLLSAPPVFFRLACRHATRFTARILRTGGKRKR
jgi:glycosyltransferase involved in cell wall biosynthesis